MSVDCRQMSMGAADVDVSESDVLAMFQIFCQVYQLHPIS